MDAPFDPEELLAAARAIDAALPALREAVAVAEVADAGGELAAVREVVAHSQALHDALTSFTAQSTRLDEARAERHAALESAYAAAEQALRRRAVPLVELAQLAKEIAASDDAPADALWALCAEAERLVAECGDDPVLRPVAEQCLADVRARLAGMVS